MPSAPTVARELDVAIIGGGPAGLAAAHAIAAAAPHLKVAVLERVSELMRRGAGFSLEINGQKALHAINPGLQSAAEKLGVRRTGGSMYGADGALIQHLGASHDESKARFGFSAFLLAWSDLQQLLAEKLLDNIPLHLGQQLERYEELPDGSLLLHLAGQEPVHTQLLVAADGYYSKVRQQCLADGPPTYSGTAAWRARVGKDSAEACGVKGDTSAWYQGDFRVMMCYPISGGEVVWSAYAPDEQLQEAGIDCLSLRQQRYELSQQAGEDVEGAAEKGKAAKERCLKVFDGYPDAVKSMMRDTPDSVVIEHGLFTRAGEDMTPEWFGRGRVVIIGDAAHPMRPVGQGLNQALEDAYHLGCALAGGVDEAALQSFRASRAERVAPVAVQSHHQAMSSYKKETQVPALRVADYEEFLFGMDLQPLAQLAASG